MELSNDRIIFRRLQSSFPCEREVSPETTKLSVFHQAEISVAMRPACKFPYPVPQRIDHLPAVMVTDLIQLFIIQVWIINNWIDVFVWKSMSSSTSN
ncbi:hypothetical protein CDAR_573951 [Caerostris darwini]|uniref:Uncharacterized protein n=1 Tax=Caerostris darwini TaxID=1538125 RepID=A0AAV4T521_9ARAC|nr:hypothetical protein CDAR_573951 [Caerostris darwini]